MKPTRGKRDKLVQRRPAGRGGGGRLSRVLYYLFGFGWGPLYSGLRGLPLFTRSFAFFCAWVVKHTQRLRRHLRSWSVVPRRLGRSKTHLWH